MNHAAARSQHPPVKAARLDVFGRVENLSVPKLLLYLHLAGTDSSTGLLGIVSGSSRTYLILLYLRLQYPSPVSTCIIYMISGTNSYGYLVVLNGKS